MKRKYDYSLTEIEEMLPYEREVYMMLIADDIERENAKIRQQG